MVDDGCGGAEDCRGAESSAMPHSAASDGTIRTMVASVVAGSATGTSLTELRDDKAY
jgi:hypothetical protein